MKHLHQGYRVLAAILCLSFVYATSDSQETSSATSMGLSYVNPGEEDCSQAFEELLKEFLALPRVDFLQSSAAGYMTRRDFAVTEIMGPVALGTDGEECLLAFRQGRTYALDLPAIDPPLFPGLYWTSGRGGAWTVLLPEGGEVTYWVDREL